MAGFHRIFWVVSGVQKKGVLGRLGQLCENKSKETQWLYDEGDFEIRSDY